MPGVIGSPLSAPLTFVRRCGVPCIVPSPLCGQMVPFVNFVGKTNIKNHDSLKMCKLLRMSPYFCAQARYLVALLARITVYIFNNSMCPAELLYWCFSACNGICSGSNLRMLLSTSSVKLVPKITISIKLYKLVKMSLNFCAQVRCSVHCTFATLRPSDHFCRDHQ